MGDNRVCDFLPPETLMRPRFALFDTKDGVQKQHSLFGPRFEKAVRRRLNAKIAAQLLENIAQRGRNPDAWGNRECQAMCLAFTMIGILTEYDSFDFIRFDQFQRSESARFLRVNRRTCAIPPVKYSSQNMAAFGLQNVLQYRLPFQRHIKGWLHASVNIEPPVVFFLETKNVADLAV